MIDPVIFSFTVPVVNFTITLRWYGVLVMLGALVGTWIAEREITRRRGKGEVVWDVLAWVLIPAIVGARLWYVVNATLGGNPAYIENPLQIINIPEGGLHFFGGLLFGALGLLWYLKSKGLDVWLFLDAIAPAALIGQAVARPANFINQELYGPPTALPWGVPIDYEHRLTQYRDLSAYPLESARFHPTFAYEMIWNLLAALFLLWLARRYKKQLKPGAVFGGWLVLAGVGRWLIEFLRPDQPKIPGTQISYSAIVALLMAAAGVVLLLVRFGKVQLAAAKGWEKQYDLSGFEVVETEAARGKAPQTSRKAALEHRTGRSTKTSRSRSTKGK